MANELEFSLEDALVRTPVSQLRSLSDTYPGERHEPLYLPPSHGLNSTSTVLL